MSRRCPPRSDQAKNPLATTHQKPLPAWQDRWDESDKGRHTYNLIKNLSRDLYFLSPPTTAFLIGRQPFKQILKISTASHDNSMHMA